jgi:DNA-binding beta-propeller fold protein YncE
VALNGPTSVSVSPDGKSLYSASFFSDAVAIFDRDTTTGALTQKPGTDGCIAKTSTGGACTLGTQVDGASSVSVSPDGKNAYVASYFSDAVAIFDRDATTGKLTQKANPDGCVSNTGSGDRCADGTALDGASSVSVSADGKNAYATSYFSDAVTVFDRNASTGGLTQKPGTDGCISWTGTGGACVDGEALNGASSVTVSPDGKNVYAASVLSKAITIFDRNSSTGALTQEPGVDGCISETGTGGNCTDGVGLDRVQSIAVAPDSKSVYAAAPISSAVSVFGLDDGKVGGKASAGSPQKQKGKKIQVAVKVKADEDLAAKAWGKIKVGGKNYKLKTAKASVVADDSATLKLKPAESKDAKKIAKGLKKKNGKAKITAQLSDDYGNSTNAKLKVSLKG